jgi:hypothetical protein
MSAKSYGSRARAPAQQQAPEAAPQQAGAPPPPPPPQQKGGAGVPPPAAPPVFKIGTAPGTPPPPPPPPGGAPGDWRANLQLGGTAPASGASKTDFHNNSGQWSKQANGNMAPSASATANLKTGNNQNTVDGMWADIQKSSQAGLDDKLTGTYADEALNARRNSEMNAAAGSGVGGAFAGGAAQVALGGMQQRTDVRNEHHKQNLQMKMTYLQRMMEQAERDKDRNLQAWLQTESDKTAMTVAQMEAQGAMGDTNAMLNPNSAPNPDENPTLNFKNSDTGDYNQDGTTDEADKQAWADRVNNMTWM